ncbi:hypothetical protein [Reinekea sp. G2M2-21]|uniref:hypothetical protein n=1 Tax=Reinekea sp. G2M2-21 TaxID=2788942 RepID=UPI0018A8DC1B|nr:hypothetical protein [Reinekea sp. G2M2-21]
MIIQKDKRREKLIEYGVIPAFLDAIDNTGEYQDLEFIVKYPDGAYWYLEDIYPSYSIFKGYDVTPIYEGGNGDTFYVLLSNNEEARFVHFELENDEIYNDYGSDFWLMFVDFLIGYYEFADESSIDALTESGLKMGFPKSADLFSSLESADKNGLRNTFDLDKKWREENVHKFL